LKEKLIIKNFGPIKSVELELGRFNVLIGEQATGKSTVAKLLAVCRYFSYIAMDDAVYGFETKFSAGLAAWGLNEAVKQDSYIFYECKHYSLTVEQKLPSWITGFPDKNGKYHLNVFWPSLKPKSNEFINLLTELNKIWSSPRQGPANRIIPTSFFTNDVANVMDNPFYLPAERGLQSIFSLGKSSIENISDSLFNQLAQLDKISRLFGFDTDIEPLDIVYKNEQGKGYVRKKAEDQFFSIFYAATGYQSTIPAVLVAKYYNELRKKNKTIIIEEPELNLFPTTQQQLMQYLVNNVMNYDNSMLLTTHSPYVLASLNNMLYAYKVGQTYADDVDKIISKKYWLNPSEFSAYRLLNGGTSRNIVDKELEEVAVEELDGAGKEINEAYDRILAIKFGRNEKFE